MSKIICDICGTTYPGSSDCCPICGYSNAETEDIVGADISYEELLQDSNENADKPSSKTRKKEIFDFDEVNTVNDSEEEDGEDYDEEDEEETPRHNAFVVILLTVLIVVLLGVAGFIFVRYFLPNMGEDETVPTTIAMQEEETTAPSTEPTVPCQQMAMTNAAIAELSAEGQQFLLHIKALPENTTDKIIYTSADESIATVTEEGKITAVSEGETVIYISCGKYSIECPVIVKYVEETVPPTTEETVPEESVAEETVADDTAAGETEPAETVPEETFEAEDSEQPVENKDNANLKNVTLKLKKTDIQLGVYYQFQLVLDCDLEPEEVTWSSEHPHIATVDEKGNVTAVKSGTTAVTAKYGDQEVQCMIRCIWY